MAHTAMRGCDAGRHKRTKPVLRVPRSGGKALAGDRGGQMAVSDDAVPQGWRDCHPALGRKEPSGHAGLGSGALELLFAPGPADARWPTILARSPQLEPAVRRMAHGLADRVDRLRAGGNGVVPLAAALAWRSLDALLAADAAARAAAVSSAA